MSTRRSDHAERRLKRRNNSVAKHRAETAHVEGSGTACTCNTNAAGWLSPVMKLGLIGAPVMASYSPTVPEALLATKRLLPKIARPLGPSTVMKVGLIRAPVVAFHSETLAAPLSETKRLLPKSASFT